MQPLACEKSPEVERMRFCRSVVLILTLTVTGLLEVPRTWAGKTMVEGVRLSFCPNVTAICTVFVTVVKLVRSVGVKVTLKVWIPALR